MCDSAFKGRGVVGCLEKGVDREGLERPDLSCSLLQRGVNLNDRFDSGEAAQLLDHLAEMQVWGTTAQATQAGADLVDYCGDIRG